MLDLEDFSYDHDEHLYRFGGIVRPSATGILSRLGVIDYSKVPQQNLEVARLRGDLVHLITAERDRTGEMPWEWATADCIPRLEAYELFLHDYRGRIEFVTIEEPRVAKIAGMTIGGTPDRELWIDDLIWSLDLKCSAMFQAGWKLQLAFYQMMRTGVPACGQTGRMILQLLSTGKYKMHVCDNPADGAAAIGLLSAATWMQNEGIYQMAKAA